MGDIWILSCVKHIFFSVTSNVWWLKLAFFPVSTHKLSATIFDSSAIRAILFDAKTLHISWHLSQVWTFRRPSLASTVMGKMALAAPQQWKTSQQAHPTAGLEWCFFWDTIVSSSGTFMNLNESEVTSFSPPPPLPSSAILLPPVTVAFVPNPLASWVTPWPQVGGFNHQTWWTFMGFPQDGKLIVFFQLRSGALRFEERRCGPPNPTEKGSTPSKSDHHFHQTTPWSNPYELTTQSHGSFDGQVLLALPKRRRRRMMAISRPRARRMWEKLVW